MPRLSPPDDTLPAVSLDSYSSIPPMAAALFDTVGGRHLFTSRPWYDAFLAAGLQPEAEPLFFVLAGGGQPRAVIPCRRTRYGDPTVSSLTSFYSCDFQPLIAAGQDHAETAFDLGRQLADRLSGEAAFGFDSLDSTLPILEPLLAGLARPGRALLRYAHFGRWWENLEGRTFAQYLAARDGALREVIRRKGARLERDGATFAMIGAGATAAEIAAGIADYEAVYAASWKEAEPFPAFQPILMRRLGEAGWLRLAICRQGGRPIAAQLWVVVGGTATVLKLAHDREFDRASPGTVLTGFAIRTLMESDRVASLDFGRGDDPYKCGWATSRTPHIGVLSVSIARRPGLIARHFMGAAARKLRPRERPARA
jgi:CelD/BcsL family acetyltransferase involved in cellulose biosynthesis